MRHFRVFLLVLGKEPLMYQLVRFLGWFVAFLFFISVVRYFLRMGPFKKMPLVVPLRRLLVKLHRPLGVLTFLFAIIHASMAFTNISPSITGSAAFVTMLVIFTIGALMHYKRIQVKNVKLHRLASLILVLLIALHILFPYILIN